MTSSPLLVYPLEAKHAHARDRHVSFRADVHEYTVTQTDREPEVVPVSVSKFSERYFKQFNGRAVVDKWYDLWKSDASRKYHAGIHAVLADGGTDEDAKQAIVKAWSDNGRAKADEGTAIHAEAERLCNGIDPTEESPEMDQLRAWLADWQPHMEWKPMRTEWILWWEDPRIEDAVLVAGTLDLLLYSETTKEYALVDFKHTDPTPKDPSDDLFRLGPNANPRHHPGFADAPLALVENSKWGQYTMQLNILAKMLRERYAIDVGRNMYLLQLHHMLPGAHCIRVDEHTAATNALFAIEAARRSEQQLNEATTA